MNRSRRFSFFLALLTLALASTGAWAAEPTELISAPVDPFGVPGFIRLLHDAGADELILAVTPQDLRSTAFDQFFATWEVSAPQGVQTQPSPPMSLSTFGPWSETIRQPVSGNYRAELVLERPRTDGRLEASRRFTFAFTYNAVSAQAELDTQTVTTATPRASRAGSLSQLRSVGGLQILKAEASGFTASQTVSGVFRPEERAISIDFSWRGARPGSTLEAKWLYLEGAERLPWLTQQKQLHRTQGEDRFTFIIDEEEQWFAGDYVVEISSGGQMMREVFFSVRPAGVAQVGRPLKVVSLTVAVQGAVPQPAGPGAVVPSDAQRVDVNVLYQGGTPGQRLTSRWYFVEGLSRRSFSESTIEIVRPDQEASFAFSLRPGERWLEGSYEVDIFSERELLASATYRVSAPAGRIFWPTQEQPRVALRPDPVPAGEECIVEGRGFSPNGIIPLESIVLTDSTGRSERFRGEAIRLSPEGTFALRFRLPLTTRQGAASLAVTDQSRRTATVNFQVAEPLTVKEQLKEIERGWKEIFR